MCACADLAPRTRHRPCCNFCACAHRLLCEQQRSPSCLTGLPYRRRLCISNAGCLLLCMANVPLLYCNDVWLGALRPLFQAGCKIPAPLYRGGTCATLGPGVSPSLSLQVVPPCPHKCTQSAAVRAAWLVHNTYSVAKCRALFSCCIHAVLVPRVHAATTAVSSSVA